MFLELRRMGTTSFARTWRATITKSPICPWPLSDEEVAVPGDAALLVIAGPTGELPAAHANALNAYMAGRDPDGEARREGARLIFLAEHDTDDSFRAFLAFWGVVVTDAYIRDVERSQPNAPRTLRVGIYNPQAPPEIVAPRGQPLSVAFMPGAAAVQPIVEESNTRIVGPHSRNYSIRPVDIRYRTH